MTNNSNTTVLSAEEINSIGTGKANGQDFGLENPTPEEIAAFEARRAEEDEKFAKDGPVTHDEVKNFVNYIGAEEERKRKARGEEIPQTARNSIERIIREHAQNSKA
ncbi:MAG: hypothetical protein LBH41_02370 [Rickettsiales bacterium]|nr:hypothetical protein [Rickettsiales bacterium]